jgi:phosphoglycerate dehydrogenase-like enzyme
MPRRAELREERPEPRLEEPAPAVPAAAPSREGTALAEEVLRLLEERGVPSGAWLVDIAQARGALRQADALLRRLEEAIVRAAAVDPLDGR